MKQRRPALPLDRIARRLSWLILLGLAGNVGYTLLVTDQTALRATLRLDPGWLLAAVALAVAPLGLNTLRVWRWARLLKPGVALGDALRVVLIAEVGAAVTPSALGGSPLKIAALARRGFGTAGGVTITALGSLEDAGFVVLALPLAAWGTGLLPRFLALTGGVSPASWWGPRLLLAAGILLALATVAWLAMRGRRGARRRVRLRRWWRETRALITLIRRRGLGTYLGNVALASLQWSCRLSIVTALAAGLGASLDPWRSGVLQWLCTVVMAVTPTPGAIGGAEAAFVMIFGRELPAGLTPLTLAAWRLVAFYGLQALALLLLAVLPARWPRLPGRPARCLAELDA